MPCRKEKYIFLEQSVTVDTKEMDALVTKIGEALQLHNNSTGSAKGLSSCLHGLANNGGVAQTNTNHNNNNSSVALQRRTGCCARRALRSRASPYTVPSSGDRWDQLKAWSRKRLDVAGGEEEEEDDPHRLLQELILSGNLIKEAVRRLQEHGNKHSEALPC